MALDGRGVGGQADNGHRSQGARPHHLPGVSSFSEANLAPAAVRRLGHGVSVQRKAIRFDVDVPRAVVGVPRVEEGAQLGLVCG